MTAVVAPLSMEGELSESQLVQVPLEMRDANGKTLDLPYTTMEDDIVDVTVSVYKQVELPLVVNFINVPSYFDVNTLQYSLSQETLLVSGPERVVNNLTELSVGSFDLSTFSLDKDYQMNVEPAGRHRQQRERQQRHPELRYHRYERAPASTSARSV